MECRTIHHSSDHGQRNVCFNRYKAPLALPALFWLALVLAPFPSFSQKPDLRSGDIVFVSSSESALSSAIDEVTQTEKKSHYAHMGLIEKRGDSLWVIHADGEFGVMREPLKSFTQRHQASFVYRIKGASSALIDSAIHHATNAIGQPYDHTYIADQPGYYCSELVHDAFRSSQIFKMNPMTFKSPNGEFNSTWVEYYDQMGIEIPEGKPGCNPNEMSANPRLRRITSL